MNENATAARFLAKDGIRTLPIACRLVPLDQWLVTHVDTSWKIKDIKHWILSKCNVWGTSGAPQPPRFRPASPVTFSAPSRRSSLDSGSWAETEEGGEVDDWDVFAALDYNAELRASDSGLAFDSAKSPLASTVPEHAMSAPSFYMPPTSQRTSSEREFAATSAQYTLVSFSNGFILEDDADLSWYKPRPFELLEVHRAGAIVSLPRSGIAYAEPYFESPVRVSDRPHGKRTTRNSDDQRAHTVEWKPRWAIIRDGVLHLCKEAHTLPTHRFPISALCALSGPEQFGLATTGKSTPAHVICAKFRRMSVSGRFGGDESDDAIARATQRSKKLMTGSWVILDMPNRSSFESLLRILHRLAPYPLLSSFLPSRTPMSSPTSASPPHHLSYSEAVPSSPSTSDPSFMSSSSALFGVQYPEWRLALLQRSRTAGRGGGGSALALAQANCLFTNNGACEPHHHPLPRARSISEGLRRRAEQASASMGSEDEDADRESDTSGVNLWKVALSEYEDDDDEEDDVESEVEWDGWVRDLARRATRPPPLSPPPPILHNSAHVSPSSPYSSEPDYDYTESGGTARVRTVSYAPHPMRPISPQRARSNTISAAGTAFGATYTYTSTTTTTITTYVDRVPDRVPDLRAPPSSPAPGTWTHHSYAGPTLPSPSLVSSPRNTPRARRVRVQSDSPVIGTPIRLTPPQNASGSGSRAASVSGSEVSSVGDMPGGSGRSGGMGGVRRIVRGVSIRNAFSVDRFARKLEDSLDFVDGR